MNKSNAFLSVRAYKIVLAVLVCVAMIAWVKQNALKNYWEQSYHNTDVWDKLSQNAIWQRGDIEWDNTKLTQNLTITNQMANDWLNQTFYADVLAKQAEEQRLAELALKQRQEQEQQERERQLALNQAPKALEKVTIATGQKVFFVGDSLMQGVAPWVMKRLKDEHNIQSINLSKQSTGLSYDKFLNWGQTTETTFKQNKDIGLMIVFLGPNDPWAVPDPKDGKSVAFDSPRWHEIYHNKMQKLIDAATARNSQIIWVLPPNAKKPQLNHQMIALRKIMANALNPTQILVLNAQELLGKNDTDYSDSLTLDGKVIKMRTSDGIHFTPDGQKRVANAIFDKIEVL